MNQEQIEQTIFKRFLPNHPNNLELATMTSLKPPNPDIQVKSKTGETITFELSEITDEELARNINSKTPHGGFINEDPSFSRLNKKSTKNYPNNHPIELLLYYDRYPVHLAKFELPNVKTFIRDNINKWNFRTIWIYAYQENKVLLKIDKTGE